MAQVPKSEGHRGGITAFILPYDTEGVTVEHRNAFMGLRGIENSVTRLENVFVPAENLIGREGQGLKIALSTLNTGRLALPAICVGTAKWATKIAREFAAERVQWGQPVGKHDAVAQKIAFIAASAFGLEAMLDVASRLADDKRNDIRIEAAIAKLYGSELGWQVVDELVQVRGGRGYETAESLKARGEKPVPVEQLMRDMRINRIFEGSTEIMHLLIAREAVDQHLEVAGDLLEGEGDLKDKARSAVAAGAFYAKWLPKLAVGEGQKPGAYEEFGAAGRAPALRRAQLAQAGALDVLRDGPLAGEARAASRRSSAGSSTSAPSCSRSRRAVVYAETLREEQPERGDEAASSPTCSAGRRGAASDALFTALWANDDDSNYELAMQVLGGALHLARGGDRGPGRRRPDGRRAASGGREEAEEGAQGQGREGRGTAPLRPPLRRSSDGSQLGGGRNAVDDVTFPEGALDADQKLGLGGRNHLVAGVDQLHGGDVVTREGLLVLLVDHPDGLVAMVGAEQQRLEHHLPGGRARPGHRDRRGCAPRTPP